VVIGATAGGPPDRAKMMDVFRRHGMTVAAPPPAKSRAVGMVSSRRPSLTVQPRRFRFTGCPARTRYPEEEPLWWRHSI